MSIHELPQRELPSGAPTPVVEIPHDTDQQTSRIRQALVRATAVVAFAGIAGGGLVGCTPEDTPDTTSATAIKADRGVAAWEFKQHLLKTSPELDDARKLIPKISANNPTIQTSLEKAIRATVAREILDEAYTQSTTEEPFSAVSLDGLTDGTLRTKTAQAVYVFGADNAIDRIGGDDDPYTLALARKDITSHMPVGAEKQRDHALEAAEKKYAEDLESELLIDDEKEAEVRGKLSAIQNPTVRANAERAIDFRDATKVLDQMSYGGITLAEARADLANVKNTDIRKAAQKAAQAYARDHYDDTALDIDHRLSDQQYKHADSLENYDTPQTKDVKSANDYKYEVGRAKFAALDEADSALGEEFAASAGITPALAKMPPPLADPNETLDLSELEGKQTVKNSYKIVAPAEDKVNEEDTYEQFGEVYAKDGRLVFDLQEGDGITPKLAEQIKEAYAQVLPFAEAAFASGELISIRLIVDGSYDPSYLPTTREVYLTLPKDDDMTMDRLVSGWRHELLHSISRNAMQDLGVSKNEVLRFAAACNNMKAAVYDDFESTLRYDPSIIANLRAAALPAHKPIIDTLAKAVKSNTLVATLKSPTASLQYDSMGINQCLGADNSMLLMNTLQLKSGVEATTSDLQYLFDSKAYAVFDKKWKDMIEYGSLYDKVINESSYVTSADLETEYLGHSEDNGSEMFASILDAPLTSHDKFAANLKAVTPEDRKVVLDMLAICTHLMGKHDSLRPYAAMLQKRYKLPA